MISVNSNIDNNEAKLFEWSMEFETGLDNVDEQHKKLVSMVNDIGKATSERVLTKEEVDAVFKELVEYADYHFKDEEMLMEEVGVYQISFKDHVNNHKLFLDEVLNLKKDLDYGLSEDKVRNVLDFLVSWLAFHILGQDQNMARQINLINRGVHPRRAYEIVMEAVDTQTAPLVKSLNGLIRVVSKRNEELLKLNNTLEEQVKERTMELLSANEKLRILAFTDQLTGIPNRRCLMETLEEYIKNKNEKSCAMMIDLDKFKGVNDTYGHDIGDKVLKEFAQTLKNSVRQNDVIARIGGDEFFVFCPNTSKEEGVKLANDLLDSIRKIVVYQNANNQIAWTGSSSIGFVYFDKVNSLQDLVKKADNAVYLAKENGRNCVSIYK